MRRFRYEAYHDVNRDSLLNDGARLDQNVHDYNTLTKDTRRIRRERPSNGCRRVFQISTRQRARNVRRFATESNSKNRSRHVHYNALTRRRHYTITREFFRRQSRKRYLTILVRRRPRRFFPLSIYHIYRRVENPFLPRVALRYLTRTRRTNNAINRLRNGTRTLYRQRTNRRINVLPNGNTRQLTNTVKGVMNRNATTRRHEDTRPRATRGKPRYPQHTLKGRHGASTTTSRRLRRVPRRLHRITIKARGRVIRVARCGH